MTPEVKAAYLIALERSGCYKAAAGSVGVTDNCARYWRNKDPQFKEDCDRARGVLRDQLMRQLKKLAIDGVTEPIFNKHGEEVGQRRKFSERALLAWLRREETGSWAPTNQVTHKVEGTVEHKHTGRVEIDALTAEQRRAARAFLQTLPDDKPQIEVVGDE